MNDTIHRRGSPTCSKVSKNGDEAKSIGNDGDDNSNNNTDEQQSRSVEHVTKKLKEMQRAIDDPTIIRPDDRKALDFALKSNAKYVNDRDFRFKFLLAEQMDAVAAAKRFCFFFQCKLDYFGPELVATDVTQDDLPDHVVEMLYNGSGQQLPLRDVAGRVIQAIFQ